MDKKDMYMKEIEEFDEEKLPNVELSNKEKSRVLNHVMEAIDMLKTHNKDVNFKIDLKDAIKIKEKLGDNSEKEIYGVKNAALMRKLIQKMAQEKEGIKDKDIIDELFIEIPSPTWWWKQIICYKMFITKDQLIVYGFDYNYSIVKNYKYKLGDIKAAGIGGKKQSYYREDEQLIIFPDNTIFLYPVGECTNEKLQSFIDTLRRLGVPDIDRSKVRTSKIMYRVILVFVFLTFIYLFYLCFNISN